MDPAELDQILSGLPVPTDANLVVGISHKDDAAVYRLPSGELLVQTVDFFTPVVDDAVRLRRDCRGQFAERHLRDERPSAVRA